MKARARRARDTRWLYRVEARAFGYNQFANSERSIEFLRELAARVWKREGAGRRMPKVIAGRGTQHGDVLMSYCTGFTDIVLARHHRNILVLLHELTHALGPCQHGAKFVRLYFTLLQRYAGFNRFFLQDVAAARGIAI